MNKIGRKKTVLLSLAVTVMSLILPLFGENFGIMLAAFSLLGIGNALMQTSLNPLVAAMIKGKHLASTLTFGQFIKAIASFLAPYIAMWGATAAMPTFGLAGTLLGVFHHRTGGRCHACGYSHKRRRARRALVVVCRLPAAADQTRCTLFFHRHNVPRRYRRRHKHHCAQGSHGAAGHYPQRSGVCNKPVLHLPHIRLSQRLLPAAFHEQPPVLRHQRNYDDFRNGRNGVRNITDNALRGDSTYWFR